MGISFELPTDVERHLRAELSDLDHVAKEAALVELYGRNGKYTKVVNRAVGPGRGHPLAGRRAEVHRSNLRNQRC